MSCLGTRLRHGGTIVDLVAVVGVIGALTAMLVPMLLTARERSGRTHCMVNLRKIGYALREYSDANRGYLPVVSWSAAMMEPEDGIESPGPQRARMPDALAMLLRTQRVSASTLICPNAEDQAEQAAIVRRSSAFDYAVHSAAATPSDEGFRWDAGLPGTFALAADRGPGFIGGELAAAEIDSDTGPLGMENSRNHGRRGQNILYADGHVEFRMTPLAGMKSDHVYRSAEGTLAISDVGKGDALLMPVED
jgi:prepilin-type processing-associated H-X9-DG protein